MIAVRALYLQAGSFRLENITFDVPDGKYGVLMGRTGSGKTTILEAICGLRPVRDGRILLRGREVTWLKASDRGIGYVPQDLALFPTMTVWNHLALALRVRHVAHKRVEQRVAELASLLEIEGLLPRKPAGLSGGEAQRVALGRALSAWPSVLCLDEPLSALDEATRSDMAALLKRVQAETGVTVLHVTHSRTEARALADRLLLVEAPGVRELPLDGERACESR